MATDRAPSARDEPDPERPAVPGSVSERLNRLFELVQDELRRVAHRKLAAERGNHTLSTTALVNETYLKLVKQQRVQWSDRAQFFALASQAMRRILVDYARRHRRQRNALRYDSNDDTDRAMGGESAIRLAATQRAEELLALDEALERLALYDKRLSRVVECRFFAGYTEEETAQALGVTARTAARDWVKAKAWLYRELHDRGDSSG
jgi:RNA polymerase sigma-70 factor (ECF subfamily)